MAKNAWDWIAWLLVIIGGLNWGLVGLFSGFDIVDYLLGAIPWLKKTVYVLVGISALYLIFRVRK